jgi:hypothetical protein
MDWTIRCLTTPITTIEDSRLSGGGLRYQTREGSFFVGLPIVVAGHQLGLGEEVEVGVTPCGDGTTLVAEWSWRGRSLAREVSRARRTAIQVAADWKNPPTLYLHGTSTKHWPHIQKEGLVAPYLASSLGLASYYANTVAESEGGQPLVLEVLSLDTNQLRPDLAALEEPVLCDDDCVEMAEELFGQAHPEVEKIPESVWQFSWAAVGSVKYALNVPFENLKRQAVDCLD